MYSSLGSSRGLGSPKGFAAKDNDISAFVGGDAAGHLGRSMPSIWGRVRRSRQGIPPIHLPVFVRCQESRCEAPPACSCSSRQRAPSACRLERDLSNDSQPRRARTREKSSGRLGSRWTARRPCPLLRTRALKRATLRRSTPLGLRDLVALGLGAPNLGTFKGVDEDTGALKFELDENRAEPASVDVATT